MKFYMLKNLEYQGQPIDEVPTNVVVVCRAITIDELRIAYTIREFTWENSFELVRSELQLHDFDRLNLSIHEEDKLLQIASGSTLNPKQLVVTRKAVVV